MLALDEVSNLALMRLDFNLEASPGFISRALCRDCRLVFPLELFSRLSDSLLNCLYFLSATPGARLHVFLQNAP